MGDFSSSGSMAMLGMAGEGIIGRGLGTGLVGGLGKGLTNMGGAAAARVAAAFPSTGFMGMGGRGMVGGTAMMGSRLAQGAGWAARGASAAARFAGPIGWAATAAMAMPGVMRAGGFGGAAEGIGGQTAEDISALVGAGGINYSQMEMAGVDSYNRGKKDVNKFVPVLGLGTNVGVGTGSQIMRAAGGAVNELQGMGIKGAGMLDVAQGGVTGQDVLDFQNMDLGMGGVRGGASSKQLQNLYATTLKDMNAIDKEEMALGPGEEDTAGNRARAVAAKRMGVWRSALIKAGFKDTASGSSALAALSVGSGGKDDLARRAARIQSLGGGFGGKTQEEVMGIAGNVLSTGLTQAMGETRKVDRSTNAKNLRRFEKLTGQKASGPSKMSLALGKRMGVTTDGGFDSGWGDVEKDVSEDIKEMGSKILMGLSGQEMSDMLRKNTIGDGMEGSAEMNARIIAGLSAGGMKGNELKAATRLLNSAAMLESTHTVVAAKINGDVVNDVTKYADMRKSDAQQYRKSTGSQTLGAALGNSGIAGAGDYAAKFEELQDFYASGGGGLKGQAYAQREQALKAALNTERAKFDDEDAAEIGILMQSMGDAGAGNLMYGESMGWKSLAQAKNRVGKATRRPGTLPGKLSQISALFGDSKSVRKALGLAGSREDKNYIKSYVKEHGFLPSSSMTALRQSRATGLKTAGIASGDEAMALASKHVNFAVSAGLGEDKGLKDAMDTSEFGEVATATGQVAAANARTEGSRGGGGAAVGSTAALNKFTAAIGEAEKRLRNFKVPPHNHDATS